MESTGKILEWLVRHDFLSDSMAAGIRNISDVPSLAVELIRQGWLTAYQARRVVSGRGESLVIGPYHLQERIARGGMGKVYRGWHTRLKRPVAIKMIQRGLIDCLRTAVSSRD